MPFFPTEFTQVNHDINRVLVHRALALLAPQAGEQVADMFCGIGNFSLPIARSGARVTGIGPRRAEIIVAGVDERRGTDVLEAVAGADQEIVAEREVDADHRLPPFIPPDLDDRDRSAGLFYVRYVDPKMAGVEEPNFFAKLFGSDNTAATLQRYRIAVKTMEGKTQISVQNSQGAPEAGEAGVGDAFLLRLGIDKGDLLLAGLRDVDVSAVRDREIVGLDVLGDDFDRAGRRRDRGRDGRYLQNARRHARPGSGAREPARWGMQRCPSR